MQDIIRSCSWRGSRVLVPFLLLTLFTGCIDGWDTLSTVRDLRLEQVLFAVKSLPDVCVNWSRSTNLNGFNLWVQRDGVDALINLRDYDAHQRVGNLEILAYPFSPKAGRLVGDLYTAIHKQCPEVTNSPTLLPLTRGGM